MKKGILLISTLNLVKIKEIIAIKFVQNQKNKLESKPKTGEVKKREKAIYIPGIFEDLQGLCSVWVKIFMSAA